MVTETNPHPALKMTHTPSRPTAQLASTIDRIKAALDIAALSQETFYAAHNRAEYSRLCTLLDVDRDAHGIGSGGSRRKLDHAKAVYATARDIQAWLAENAQIEAPEKAIERADLDIQGIRFEAISAALEKLAPDSPDDHSLSAIAGRYVTEEIAAYAVNTCLAHLSALRKYLRTWAESPLETKRAERIIAIVSGSLSGAQKAKNMAYERTISSRNQSQKTPPSELLLSLVDVLKAASTVDSLDDKNAPDHRDIILALMLTTGRRPAEVCSQQSTFTPLSERMMSFSGPAKTKGKNDGLGRVLSFPCICDTALIMHSLKLLDEAGYRSFTHTEVNKNYAVKLGRRIKDQTGSKANPSDATPYTLRHMYASYIVSRFYEDGHGDSRAAYVAKALGHFSMVDGSVVVDSTTQNAYSTYSGQWTEAALTI